MILDIGCRKTTLRLTWIGGSLMAVAVALPLLALFAGRDIGAVNFRQFDLRSLGNFPVLYTTVLFALASVLAVPVIRLAPRADRAAWRGLAAIFVYLAVDETARLHNSLDHLRVAAFGWFPLLLAHPWIAIYAVAAIALAIGYWRFLRRQPRPVAGGLMLGGALYAAGLPGAAFIGRFFDGAVAPGSGIVDLLLGLLGQSLRMAGALTLVWTLLRLLERSEITVAVEIGTARAAGPVRQYASPGLAPLPTGESRDAA